MALHIINEEAMNNRLIEQQDIINQIIKITNKTSFKQLVRFYSLICEWTHQSIKNKFKILIKLALRPFGIKKSIHYSDKYCHYENLYENLNKIVTNSTEIRNQLNYEYNDDRIKKNNIVFNMIEYNKSLGRKVVCIMAPMFNKERMKDGYYRRIKAVDDIIGGQCLKIYMSGMDCSPMQGDNPKVVYIDDTHIRIDYHPWFKKEREFINKVADFADIVYHHGVGFMDEDIIRKKHLLKIVDLHGALPEEFAMSNNYSMVQTESVHEELAMKYADYLICVTESMRVHMEQKYKQFSSNYIIMPILDQETLLSKIECDTKPYKKNPVVTYAGGTQKWQMIESMQKCMQLQPTYEYRIFVPNPNEFWATWKSDIKMTSLKVESACPELLRVAYNECQYGFVLREDITVNNVACPTKLVEYLLKGIIPILKTPNIGDFVNYGMHFISMEDFCNGKLPDENKRLSMAIENQEIIKHIVENHIKGKCQIQHIIASLEVK